MTDIRTELRELRQSVHAILGRIDRLMSELDSAPEPKKDNYPLISPPKDVRLDSYFRLLWQEDAPFRANLKELACEVYLNYEYLCQLSTKHTGQTPKKIAKLFSLEKAKAALESTDKSITEIWLDCGFEEHSHFTKSFAKAYGISPREYRKRHQFVSDEDNRDARQSHRMRAKKSYGRDKSF